MERILTFVKSYPYDKQREQGEKALADFLAEPDNRMLYKRADAWLFLHMTRGDYSIASVTLMKVKLC